MKVKALHQVAYKNIAYIAGDIFDMEANDYKTTYKDDVKKVAIIKKLKKAKNKMLKVEDNKKLEEVITK